MQFLMEKRGTTLSVLRGCARGSARSAKRFSRGFRTKATSCPPPRVTVPVIGAALLVLTLKGCPHRAVSFIVRSEGKH